MNGGFYGLRAKQINLILIALVFISIIFWRWENNPLLAALLPPQEILIGPPSIALRATKANPSIVAEKEADLQPQEHHADTGSQMDLAKNSSGIEKNKANMAVTPVTDKGNTSERDIVNGREEKHHVGAGGMPPAASSQTRERACNYAKGKWVEDNSWPLYPGFGCKQWLSGMWACRLNQRPDFTYEKFRWQPQDCVMEEFAGSKFLQRMQNKTLAFVGDSLGRQQFQSLMCMVTSGLERPDVLDVGREYGLVKARGAKRPDGWAYRFPTTNTTILYYWSASLCNLQPLHPRNRSTDYAMHLDRPPAFLQRFLQQFHVLVLNTGHHWNRGKLEANRWVIYVGGKPNSDPKINNIENAKNFTIHSIVNWVNSQLPKYPGLKAFYRSISPRHFFNGDWNTGGSCDHSTPLSGGNKVLQNESSDSVAARAVKGTKVKLLDITALSKLRDEGHISRYTIRPAPGMQDCLHWCLPGIPDTWNHILFQQI